MGMEGALPVHGAAAVNANARSWTCIGLFEQFAKGFKLRCVHQIPPLQTTIAAKIANVVTMRAWIIRGLRMFKLVRPIP